MGFVQRLVGRLFRQAAPAADGIDFRGLERIIGTAIRNHSLFAEALTHRSYVQLPGREARISNERLEFLGDSVLNFAVGEYLFHHRQSAREGDLTKNRARLVNKKSLNAYARKIRLDDFILMNPNADRSAPRSMDNILADAFEALIAAVYLDGGYEEARRFIQSQVLTAIEEGSVTVEDENFKSQLLEYAQGEGFGAPRYMTIREEGPDHDRTFTVEVYLHGKPWGVGMGKNKKDAEQAAAEKALQKVPVGPQ